MSEVEDTWGKRRGLQHDLLRFTLFLFYYYYKDNYLHGDVPSSSEVEEEIPIDREATASEKAQGHARGSKLLRGAGEKVVISNSAALLYYISVKLSISKVDFYSSSITINISNVNNSLFRP